LALAFPVTQPERLVYFQVFFRCSPVRLAPLLQKVQSLALTRPLLPQGAQSAVPSEDYSRAPPCSAGFLTGEGRETGLSSRAQKKDHENETKQNPKSKLRAPEPS
jgi:hypothetical protein